MPRLQKYFSVTNILTKIPLKPITNKAKFLREQKNVTQNELAEKQGISLRTIQRIEAGNIPKGFTLKTIAKALETESENLFQENKKLREDSSGDYLSNEIFYRVAKMRSEKRPNLKTGHFHISKIQGRNEELDSSKVQELLETVEQTLIEGFKTL